jgi:glycine/D-amino acid oxidase-like deaminating enzyme
MKHDSVWIATTGERRSRASLTGDLSVDVAVVGSGITGLTTALLTQREGARVVVIEAEHVGAGTTGRTTGKVTSQHGITYSKLLARHGQERAGQYAEANQAAIGQIASLVADLSIDCQFRRGAAYAYTNRPERRGEIEREVEACQRVGLPAVLVTSTDLPYAIAAGVRFDDQAHFHPGRYCVALGERIEAAGGYVFERTRALAVESTNDGVTVRTPSGRVRAQSVVLATLLPFAHIGGFFAKARPSRSYGLALRLRTPAPQGMYISIDSPTRSTRPWLDPGINGLIVVGESHETGHANDTRRFYRRLEEWATRTFEVEAIDYSWSAQDYITVDGVPYIGRAPGTGRTFVATGSRSGG